MHSYMAENQAQLMDDVIAEAIHCEIHTIFPRCVMIFLVSRKEYETLMAVALFCHCGLAMKM